MDVLLKSKCFKQLLFKNQSLLKSVKCFQTNDALKGLKGWTEPSVRRKTFGSQWVRQSFLDYFVVKHNHLRVTSSPVVPKGDDTVLFVSAGMNQFKPIFLDTLSPTDPMNGYVRCVNSQKCIRVGGKHCDLTTVGTDGRHHTFFEMLGNWSFGDYHKKESCRMAWDLLTQVFKLDVNRLVVTYFGGDKQLGLEPDFETRDIWLQIGLAKDRVIPLGSKDNFWEMGETGPCGICTEIHYLLEPTISTNADHLMKNCIEIWNLVFIQYNRDINGKLEPLHRHFVDTGMGLERIVSVVQNVKSNYETDLFLPYFKSIQNNSHSKPYGHSIADPLDISYRILADHSRMYTIAISDGLKSSYRGTGFILRKIIRKSIGIAGNDFGVSDPRLLLHELSAITADILGEAFPELHHNIKIVDKTIDEEFDKYQAVVSQNRRLVRALTRIDIKYSINLSQEITQKLQTISEEIDVNFKENSLSKQFLDSNRNSLHDIKDILSDYTMNLRHNLPLDMNESVDQLLERLDKYEKQLTELYCNELKALESSETFQYFVYKFETIGDKNIAFKLGLDYFGHKPAALFQTSADGKEFYIQTTVPNEYQKYLKANEWLSHISDKLKSYELLSNKRTNKKSLLKSTSMQQMDEAVICALNIAKTYFK